MAVGWLHIYVAVNKISTDLERRAVSLWQLSFLWKYDDNSNDNNNNNNNNNNNLACIAPVYQRLQRRYVGSDGLHLHISKPQLKRWRNVLVLRVNSNLVQSGGKDCESCQNLTECLVTPDWLKFEASEVESEGHGFGEGQAAPSLLFASWGLCLKHWEHAAASAKAFCYILETVARWRLSSVHIKGPFTPTVSKLIISPNSLVANNCCRTDFLSLHLPH